MKKLERLNVIHLLCYLFRATISLQSVHTFAYLTSAHRKYTKTSEGSTRGV